MNKNIEALIVQYFYSNRQVELENIGRFFLQSDIVIPTDSEKETILPEGSVRFEYDPKAKQDEGLVDFIVEHTRKIRPLASSDLESFSNLNKQFINIGKPLVIPGLGTISKNRDGQFLYNQSHHAAGKLPPKPTVIQERISDESNIIEIESKSKSGNPLKWILPLLLLIALGGGLYYYFFMYNKPQSAKTEEPMSNVKPTVVDTTKAQVTVDTTNKIPAQPIANANSFNIVIKTYPNKLAAEKAMQKLTSYGHKLVLFTSDSISYQLRMPFDLPLTDTTKMRDSLKKFFGGQPFVAR